MLMMKQQMLGMAMELDKLNNTNFAQAMANEMGVALPMATGNGSATQNVDKTEALGGSEGNESPITENARKRVANSTSPT